MIAKLEELLVSKNLITENQLKEAFETRKKEGGSLSASLIKLDFISEEKLVEFFSKQYNIPAVNLSKFKINPFVTNFIPHDVAQKYQIFPLARVGATLTVAMCDPSNTFVLDDIKFITGYNVKPVVALESAIRGVIAKYYGQPDTLQAMKAGLKKIEDTNLTLVEDTEKKSGAAKDVDKNPVVKLLNLIFNEAIRMRASDIHIEYYEKTFRVRYRIDGILYDVMEEIPSKMRHYRDGVHYNINEEIPLRLRGALPSRIKIMAGLDIAEKRLPQDGRIKLKVKDSIFDIRVSTMPTLYGEKIVMRILDKSNLLLNLTKLGFEQKELREFQEALYSSSGIILVTGPTGSGKTTTLCSAISTINTTEVNIMTVEDPIEYNIMGINQVHVKEDIGLTFASILRSFLRQDPDILMVGEVRDLETAEIAIKAALTGHLVLSTLHTNDAASCILRLVNIGIEPFLVSASVSLVLSQRLCRMVCEECKEEEKIPVNALLQIGFTEDEAKTLKCFKGKGCPACNGIGYKGRVGLYEVMPVKEDLKKLILKGTSTAEIKKTAVRLGMRTLRMSGLAKIKEGLTSVEEVLRVTFGD